MLQFVREWKEFMAPLELKDLDDFLLPKYAELDKKYDYPTERGFRSDEEIFQYYDEKRRVLGEAVAEAYQDRDAKMDRKMFLFITIMKKLLIATILVHIALSAIMHTIGSFYAN